MNLRYLIIFAFIFIYIYSIGTGYAFKSEPKESENHTPQRKIERHLPEKQQTSMDDVLILNRSVL